MKSYHEMMLLNDFLPNLEELYLSSNDLSDIPSEYLLPGKETEDHELSHQHTEDNMKKNEESKNDHFFIVGKLVFFFFFSLFPFLPYSSCY
jgi:hypothetical protein